MHVVFIVLVVTGALTWAGVAFLVLGSILSPGKGWTLSCTYGHYPYKHHEQFPRCKWSIGPKWYLPEWTKRIRARLHWIAAHR